MSSGRAKKRGTEQRREEAKPHPNKTEATITERPLSGNLHQEAGPVKKDKVTRKKKEKDKTERKN